MAKRMQLTEERMHDIATRRATYRRTALFAVLVAVLGMTSAIAVAGAGAAPPREASGVKAAQAQYQLPSDKDLDGVEDTADSCPFEAGDLRNGCPSELNAEVRANWQVNDLLTKLVRLTVAAPIGSRIELRCTGRIKICGKTKHVIAKTTHRLSSLTKFFKTPRIYRAHLGILVRVTKSRQVGLYKRYETRRGRRAPAITERCLSTQGRVQPCAG
jgi:hypothetical protein